MPNYYYHNTCVRSSFDKFAYAAYQVHHWHTRVRGSLYKLACVSYHVIIWHIYVRTSSYLYMNMAYQIHACGKSLLCRALFNLADMAYHNDVVIYEFVSRVCSFAAIPRGLSFESAYEVYHTRFHGILFCVRRSLSFGSAGKYHIHLVVYFLYDSIQSVVQVRVWGMSDKFMKYVLLRICGSS
jgi:hypothetical protein